MQSGSDEGQQNNKHRLSESSVHLQDSWMFRFWLYFPSPAKFQILDCFGRLEPFYFMLSPGLERASGQVELLRQETEDTNDWLIDWQLVWRRIILRGANVDCGGAEIFKIWDKTLTVTWRYLSWRAAPVSDITLLASARDLEAFCSPSAAMTWTVSDKIKMNQKYFSLYLGSRLSGSLRLSCLILLELEVKLISRPGSEVAGQVVSW